MGLALSRRVGERIVIDGDIVVEVTQIRGSVVRLEISAPADVEIWREELVVDRQAPDLVV